MKPSDADIDKLLTDLSSHDTEIREKAERFYSENKTEILPQIMDFGERTFITKRTPSPIERLSLWVCFGGYFVYSILLGYTKNGWKGSLSAFAAHSGIFLAAYILLRMWLRRDPMQPRYVSWLRQIAENDDPRNLPYKIQVLTGILTKAIPIIEPNFYRQLALVEAEDAPLFEEKHRRIFRKWLLIYAVESKISFDEDKSLAILTALDHIGTVREIPTLIKVEGIGYSQKIRGAARQSIQAIKQRQQEQNPRETLLRASENTGGQEELLRSAHSNADTQAETLLRVPKEE